MNLAGSSRVLHLIEKERESALNTALLYDRVERRYATCTAKNQRRFALPQVQAQARVPFPNLTL
jgi:hypothetical protein